MKILVLNFQLLAMEIEHFINILPKDNLQITEQ